MVPQGARASLAGPAFSISQTAPPVASTSQQRHETTSTIFWPQDLKTSGVLYGWRSAGTVTVAGVLANATFESTSSRIAEVVASLQNCPTSSSLQVLGLCRIPGHTISTTTKADFSDHGLLDISIVDGMPVQRLSETQPSALFVLFRTPNGRKFRLFSVSSLPLETTSYSVIRQKTSNERPRTSPFSTAKYRQNQPQTVGTADVDWQTVLAQINASQEVRAHLAINCLKPISITSTSRGEVPNILFQALQGSISATLYILNRRVGRHTGLKDLSATAHQLDIRLRQAYTAPQQYKQSHMKNSLVLSESRAQYISFYNMLWLIANDVIIGSAVMSFICENNASIAQQFAYFLKSLTVNTLQDTLIWLNNWPVGLKLNFELGSFFCNAFLWFTSIWEAAVLDDLLVPRLPIFVYCIGLAASLGTTMALALSSDLLSISTFHLYAFYSVATAVFSFHTKTMGSLFNIFRGKKHNVLRKRTEPSDYTLDQLLVGAIFFTLAAFLLPTVLAFYLAFAVTRLGIIAIHAFLEACLAFLNHFPLFALMLRCKDPQRLPGGLAFSIEDSPVGTFLRLESKPMPPSAILHQYWSLWSSFSQHYSLLYILRKIATGRYIAPIPRSRLTFVSRERTST